MQQQLQFAKKWHQQQYKTFVIVQAKCADYQPQDFSALNHPILALINPLPIKQVIEQMSKLKGHVDYLCFDSAELFNDFHYYLRPKLSMLGLYNLHQLKAAPNNYVKVFFDFSVKESEQGTQITMVGPKILHDRCLQLICANLKVVHQEQERLNFVQNQLAKEYLVLNENSQPQDGYNKTSLNLWIKIQCL